MKITFQVSKCPLVLHTQPFFKAVGPLECLGPNFQLNQLIVSLNQLIVSLNQLIVSLNQLIVSQLRFKLFHPSSHCDDLCIHSIHG